MSPTLTTRLEAHHDALTLTLYGEHVEAVRQWGRTDA